MILTRRHLLLLALLGAARPAFGESGRGRDGDAADPEGDDDGPDSPDESDRDDDADEDRPGDDRDDGRSGDGSAEAERDGSDDDRDDEADRAGQGTGLSGLDLSGPGQAGQVGRPADAVGADLRARGVRVTHRDGFVERILGGLYELIDPWGRRVIARPATDADWARLLAGGPRP